MSARDVRQQFARSAALYATSAVHARGKDLEVVVRLACPSPTDVVLDVSTGAEHTALALSPHVARVVATDLIPEMLEVARGLATNGKRRTWSSRRRTSSRCRSRTHRSIWLPVVPRRTTTRSSSAPYGRWRECFDQEAETVRDSTHVRDWWVERSATPPELRAVLEAMLTQAPRRLRELLQVRTQPLRFCLPKAVFVAVRTGREELQGAQKFS